MVKSELYSNLKQAIDMLVELLIPEGSKELSYWGSEEDELNLLQEEISALDYSCLDEVYHGGLKEVINDNLSPAENALISGVGLLDEYGLSEEEFREWLEKQPEVYSLLLGILITGKWPDYSQWKKMEDYFEEEYRQELFDPADINISPKSGIRFAEEKPEDGSQSFYYLQKVIVFDKSFDAYDVVDENNNVVTSYEPKIKFTMSLLANLELKIIFGTVPDALECHSYEEAVEHRNQFYEIVKKYSLGEVTGNQCVLNKMYDDMFAQKGSYAFYIQWLNNEFPSEVEYQKKLQETKGLKKILVMATKPNHLATIE